MRIRPASPEDLDSVRQFYVAAGYAGVSGLGPDERILLAERNGQLRGVVRLVCEFGVIVLRGMRVSPESQRQGIGKRLLDAAAAALDREACYCIPYRHLVGFYGLIGFREIDEEEAPAFLVERLRDYRRRRPETFTIMLRPAAHSHRSG